MKRLVRKMKIEEIKDEKIWEEFVQKFKPNNFLTSWAWGDFNQKMGDKFFRLGIWDREDLVGVSLVIKTSAKRGNFLLCPAGPLLTKFDRKYFNLFAMKLEELAKQEEVKFIRIRPTIEAGKMEKIIEEKNFKPAPTHVHAQVSWILDITRSEEELLSSMRKSTRYLIRHSDKEGLEVKEQTDSGGVRALEALQKETVERHGFTPFSNEYLEEELEAFQNNDQVKILLVYKKEQLLAAAMIIFYGDSAFYHHGASVKTKTAATYLLQWEAIKTAKKFGKKYYNFWGIAPVNSPKHPWAGLTYFKQGFGGFRIEYTRPYDLPTSSFYPLIYWFEKFRASSRGLSI